MGGLRSLGGVVGTGLGGLVGMEMWKFGLGFFEGGLVGSFWGGKPVEGCVWMAIMMEGVWMFDTYV